MGLILSERRYTQEGHCTTGVVVFILAGGESGYTETVKGIPMLRRYHMQSGKGIFPLRVVETLKQVHI